MTEASNPVKRLEQMRAYYHTGATRSYDFRIRQLTRLKEAILSFEKDIFRALDHDLKKSAEEAYATESGLVLAEISFTIKRLRKWMKPKKIKTNLLNFPSSSRIFHDPYGVVLIIGSWNYPFQLLINPLVGAIAAGNCAVLKPSESAPATSAVIARMVGEFFQPQYIDVYEGEGSTVVPALMNPFRFDYIFYTGSARVGKAIYSAAAKDLIPVTLELGGKSPAVIEPSADMNATAKRIAIGKFLNAGQTCVAPDYVLVDNKVKDQFVKHLTATTRDFFGDDASKSADYGRIVHSQHFDTLLSYLPSAEKIAYGGKHNRDDLFFGPTIITGADVDDAIMQEEIFGPLLPVIGFDDKTEAMQIIDRYEKPLSFYLFTRDKASKDWWMKHTAFGSGCINNTLWHLSNPNLPFGGVGGSGLGAYHGKYSFQTFTHHKAVMSTPTWFDPKMKYPPFKGKLNLFKRFIK